MPPVPGVTRLFRFPWRGAADVRADVDDEVAFHLDERVRDLVARGVPAADARAQARREFGDVDAARRALEADGLAHARTARRREGLDALGRDLRVAVRGLRRAPGFLAVAVLCLALGIGANTAVFSVVNAVLLRPLPYPDPGRLVDLGVRVPAGDHRAAFPTADVRGFERRARSFAAVGAYAPRPEGVALPPTARGGAARRVPATAVTAGLFRTLGVAPLLGRGPRPDEDRPGAGRVVVLSHRFWRDHLGGSPAALGRALDVDGVPHTVVGVMPPGFALPARPDDRLWPVLQLAEPGCRCPFWLTTVARLAPGVSLERARAEFPALAASLVAQYPEAGRDWAYVADDLKARVVGDARATVLILYGAVALVLVLTAANVASLFLARAAGRGPELAVRAALGAGRARLARQLVTESVAVAALGGAVGLGLAAAAARVLRAAAPGDLPRLAEVRVDPTVLLVTLGTALVTGVLTGLAPALQAPHGALTVQLREGGRGATGAGRRRTRAALVVAEFAVALAVLVGAGLTVRSLLRLQRVDVGVTAATAAGVAVARLAPPEARYPEPARVAAFHEEVLGRVAAVPGVGAAAVSARVPASGGGVSDHLTAEGDEDAAGAQRPLAELQVVSPGYFGTLDLPVRRGRAFTDADREGAPLVAVINETLARQFFSGRDPLGRWVRTGGDGNPRLRVVGVVPDVRHEGLGAPPAPTVYTPLRQNVSRTMYLVVRTKGGAGRAPAGDPLALAPALRRAVAATDPGVPLDDVRSLEQLVYASAARPRLRAGLLGAFGGLAVVLAGAGIYGLMAYTVRQRRRELGVRLALGAPRGALVRLVVGDGMRLAGAGVALGLVVAFALARLLAGVLYEVSPADPVTFGVTALALAAAGLAACAVPAWRASRTDATTALRAE